MTKTSFKHLPTSTKKLCSGAVRRNKKAKKMLVEYYSSLNDSERELFNRYSQALWVNKKRNHERYKISKDAIIIAIKLKEQLNIFCYPVVIKYAVEWLTNDGSVIWSIKLVNGSTLSREILSYERVSDFTKKNSELYTYVYDKNTIVGVE